MDDARLLDEQLVYYRERADEYDEWWERRGRYDRGLEANQRWFSEIDHVRGVFDVEVQPPLQVKGQDEPLHTYLVLRARPRVFRVPMRGIEGAETPLVGRDDELTQLVTAFEGTVRERRLHAVSVLAEAGLGKSRLMHELQHRLEAHAQTCWLLLGRSQPGSVMIFKHW